MSLDHLTIEELTSAYFALVEQFEELPAGEWFTTLDEVLAQ